MAENLTPIAGLKRTLLDFAPLVGFFIGYKVGGLKLATIVMIALTVVTLAVIYAYEKRLAMLPLISGLCVMVFGTLTLALDNELFIKMRPTIVNALFGGLLMVGVYGYKTGWMKHLFSFAFTLTDAGWLILSRRWALFFLFLACLNEAVWRSVPTDVWVNVKVFGYVGLTMLFTLAQFRLVEKYTVEEKNNG